MESRDIDVEQPKRKGRNVPIPDLDPDLPIPCFVVCRNHLTNSQRSLHQISRFPGVLPILVDSASSYPPLLEWLDTIPPRQVWRFAHNIGCWGLFTRETSASKTPLETWLDQHSEEYGLSREWYCLTDDDLDFDGVPLDLLDVLRGLLERHPRFLKAGPALRIDDIPSDYPLRESINFDQDRFWLEENVIEEMDEPDGGKAKVYDSDLDTTFALYRRRDLPTIAWRGNGKSLRVGGVRQIRHLGWYKSPETMTAEDWFTLSQTEQTSSYWSASLKIYCEVRKIDTMGFLAQSPRITGPKG